MAKLDEIDLGHLLSGAAFLGSGGGGSIKAGQMFIDRIVSAGGVTITDTPPNGDGCVMADIGANAAIEAGQVDALIRSFTVMDDYWNAVHGARMTCLYPVETGPENTLAPMVLAALKGLPVFDGDGGGRAVPEVQLCSFASAGINVAPLAMANDGADAIIAFSGSAADMDKMLRPMTAAPQFGNSASMALFAAKNEDLAKASVKGAISYAMEVGRFLDAMTKKDPSATKPFLNRVNERNACLMAYGEVTIVEDEMEGAFDLGKVVVKDALNHGNVTIYTQNENIIAFSSTESSSMAVAPHSICYLRADLQPITNAEIKKGDKIWLMGVEAKSELTSASVLDGFAIVLSGLGYGGPVGSLHPKLRWKPLGNVLLSLPKLETELDSSS